MRAIDAEVCTHVTGQVLLLSLPALVKNTPLQVLICGPFLVLLADVSYRPCGVFEAEGREDAEVSVFWHQGSVTTPKTN